MITLLRIPMMLLSLKCSPFHNRIASCSSDKAIKKWKSNPPYRDIPIKVLRGRRYYVYSALYIKERDIIISGSADRTLRL